MVTISLHILLSLSLNISRFAGVCRLVANEIDDFPLLAAYLSTVHVNKFKRADACMLLKLL